MPVTTHPPHNTQCGDVFTIERRRAQIKRRRKLRGAVGKTCERSTRGYCECEPRYMAEVTDGTYIALCESHVDKAE